MTDNGSPVNADSAHLTAEDIPLRLRVHALARLLGSTSRDVLGHLGELGVTARTAQSSISRDDAMLVAARYGAVADDDAPATPAADAPAGRTSADPKPSLFSAVEVVEPTASASAGETAAPLFLSAGSEAAKKAEQAKKSEPAAKKDEPAAEPEAETGAATSSGEKSGAQKSEPQNAGAKKAGAKTAGAKKSGSKKADDNKSDGEKSGAEKSGAESSGPEKSGEKTSDGKKAASKKAGSKKSAAKTTGDESVETQAVDAPPAAEATDIAAAHAGEDTDGSHESADSDSDDASSSDSRSRRRRRGRRGRGRGRGDQADGGEQGDTDDEQNGPSHGGNDSSADSAPDDKQTGDQQAGEKQAGDKQAGEKQAGDKQTAGKQAGEKKSGEDATDEADDDSSDDANPSSKRRRRRRRRRGAGDTDDATVDDPPNTVVHEREPRTKRVRDEVQGISGSTRLEAKRQRRRDGRDAGRRRPPILTESEFLARREAVERVMVIRERSANAAVASHDAHSAPTEDYTQVAVLEDGVLVEHFVTTETSQSMVGNIYLGRVQNVLPGMEAAFVDIGRGRNGVLYAGEVNWEAAGLDGRSRKIEQALKPGDYVLVQVSKDPVGHKGARLTTQISLAGRYLVYVPGGSSTGISRKLPDTERKRLKQILSKVVPDGAGVIIRTASEGVSEDELAADVARLESQWKRIESAAAEYKKKASGAPHALYEEPDLLVRVVRDLFNEDFSKLVVEGDKAWKLVSGYVRDVAPDLFERVDEFTKPHADAPDSFDVHRIDEQLAKALDRKVWLPSGGTLIIEHTEAMTVVDVNTGKFTGSGGNLEETVTRNNLEAAEEIVRQMRLRDIGGMIIVDFIDMVLESNRDLVLRRLTEALGRDRTRHQVSEVTSLGLVQMTRKRLGTGLLEAFSTTCTACAGRGVIVHANPVEVRQSDDGSRSDAGSRRSRRKKGSGRSETTAPSTPEQPKSAAPHKPAAEHPLFRAMAHHEDDEAADEGKRDETPTRQKDVDTTFGPRAKAPEPANTPEPEKTPEPDKTPESEKTPEPAKVAAGDPEPAPVATVTRRRRAVRRTSAPTSVAPEPVTVTTAEPVTTVAAQTAEPVVAVTRTPRRRTGRRAAGPPPSEQ
ncbi:translation initiation factor IF-2 N-terminal domain-containing protein [Gordonia liuliyuniae]|uniref:Translation initiation factor IF-2 N-terminal domain-containing protein n=1 Tax=Gordonia liuliyuniae TaxID=2911517 RepID=A0ABS9IRV2_9ACTN|nr:translation initiation factor IF-2 N-terminal domain-containing protein [Gordonia liuliyuniae]MCF8588272.1 translation initiation factor IF-2 N-terminal domain-containing protein [Gordonia liuliyuniae]